MALVTPPLVYLALAAVDFGRVYYVTDVLSNCASNGALYASDSFVQQASPYSSVSQAALADASNLNPTPTVTSSGGTDASGNSYVSVTVTYTFTTIVNYPGIPSSTTISRTVQARVAPSVPSS
jgi:Flp pilus assembly protein TadG